MTDLTSGDMIAMLRRHYLPEGRPPGGVFAPEIGSPCGARRADLIWLSTTGTGQRQMIGHEVKVSRSDVIVELRDPTKADPWMQYCDRWYLVVSDPALIEGLEIPEPWGVMAPPSGRRTRSMTVVRKAPVLKPSAAAAGVHRVTAWLNQKFVSMEWSQDREVNWRDQSIQRLEAQVAELRANGSRTPSPHDQRIRDIDRAVTRRLRDEQVWGTRPSDEDIVQALVDLCVLRQKGREVRRYIASIAGACEGVAKAADSLPALSDDEAETLFGASA